MVHDILKDVSRTLPNHVYFQKEYKDGQNDLYEILKCIHILEPEIGYVQGMGYMAAVLLTYMDKDDALGIMMKILNGNQYNMKSFFGQEMIGLKIGYY